MAKTDLDKVGLPLSQEGRRDRRRKAQRLHDEKRRLNKIRKLGSPGFVASKHVRQDWSADDLMYWLEERARGYDGPLREILCSSAYMIRKLGIRLAEIEKEKQAQTKPAPEEEDV